MLSSRVRPYAVFTRHTAMHTTVCCMLYSRVRVNLSIRSCEGHDGGCSSHPPLAVAVRSLPSSPAPSSTPWPATPLSSTALNHGLTAKSRPPHRPRRCLRLRMLSTPCTRAQLAHASSFHAACDCRQACPIAPQLPTLRRACPIAPQLPTLPTLWPGYCPLLDGLVQ